MMMCNFSISLTMIIIDLLFKRNIYSIFLTLNILFKFKKIKKKKTNTIRKITFNNITNKIYYTNDII